MPHRRLPFALLLLSLLPACSKPGAGPILDLVGSTRYTSYDRTITTPGDTVTFKLYSEASAKDRPLAHVRIFVDYEPVKEPISYPTNYDPTKAVGEKSFVFLDSAMSASEFVLQTTLNSRTTSGREYWRFEAEDSEGNKTSRGFRLQLRNLDSTLVYHRYSAQLQAPDTRDKQLGRRSFLALLSGLTLPGYTVRTNAGNQSLIDVVYLADNGGIRLAAPADSLLAKTALARWPVRRTNFRTTALNKAAFDAATTTDVLAAAFAGTSGARVITHTDILVKGKVYAFKTQNQKSGLIYVQDILTTPFTTLLLQVRITK